MNMHVDGFSSRQDSYHAWGTSNGSNTCGEEQAIPSHSSFQLQPEILNAVFSSFQEHN